MTEIEKLRSELEAARRDIHAYRGALGYPVPGNHDGKLTDGTTPQCGLCNSEYRKNLEKENARLAAALEHISAYPVHSEPIGGAMDMKDIAYNALKDSAALGDLLAPLAEKLREANVGEATDHYRRGVIYEVETRLRSLCGEKGETK